MSEKDNCYDNAVAEICFKTLNETRYYAKNSVFEYIEAFYNIQRWHSALGNLTIKEYQNLMSNPSK